MVSALLPAQRRRLPAHLLLGTAFRTLHDYRTGTRPTFLVLCAGVCSRPDAMDPGSGAPGAPRDLSRRAPPVPVTLAGVRIGLLLLLEEQAARLPVTPLAGGRGLDGNRVRGSQPGALGAACGGAMSDRDTGRPPSAAGCLGGRTFARGTASIRMDLAPAGGAFVGRLLAGTRWPPRCGAGN